MSDDSNFDCENNINVAARAYCDNLLPSVSRERYEKVFQEFEAWCNRKKVKQITEEVVLASVPRRVEVRIKLTSRKKYRTRKRILLRPEAGNPFT
jgi:hypothetical protein